MPSERFFIGLFVLLDGKIPVYPPTVEEVISTEDFSLYRQLLLISDEDLEDLYQGGNFDTIVERPTPFEYLLLRVRINPKEQKILEEALEFFIRRKITLILERGMILVGDPISQLMEVDSIDEIAVLNEENFFRFQNLVRQSIGDKPLKPYPHYTDLRRIRFEAKIRERDRVKAKQSGVYLSPITVLASTCALGVGITPENIGKMTYASLNLVRRYYQEKESHQHAIRALTSGFGSKKSKAPKYWMRDLDEE